MIIKPPHSPTPPHPKFSLIGQKKKDETQPPLHFFKKIQPVNKWTINKSGLFSLKKSVKQTWNFDHQPHNEGVELIKKNNDNKKNMRK